jgi:predicted small lipoprotein YifL
VHDLTTVQRSAASLHDYRLHHACPVGLGPVTGQLMRHPSWRSVVGVLLVVSGLAACGNDGPVEADGLGAVSDLQVAELDVEDARAVVEAIADAGAGRTNEEAALVAAEAYAAHRQTIADDALASGRGSEIFAGFLDAVGPDEQAAAIAARATLAAAREQVAAVPVFPMSDRGVSLAGAAAGSLVGALAESESAGDADGRLVDLEVAVIAGYIDAARVSTDESAVRFLDGVRAWAAVANGGGPVPLLMPVEGGEALVDLDTLPEAERATTLRAISALRTGTGVPEPVRVDVSAALEPTYVVAERVFTTFAG